MSAHALRLGRRGFLTLAAGAACSARALPGNAILYVEDFRRAGMDDRAVIAAASERFQSIGSGVLRFGEGRVYDLGLITDGPDLFSVSGMAAARLEGNGARIVATSTHGAVWNCFSFSNIDGLEIADLNFWDRGFRGDAAGMKALVFQPGMSGTRNVKLSNIRAERVLSMVQTQGPVAGAPRVEKIFLANGCEANRSYYGLCCQDQGDFVSGALRATNCRRPYLVHGVEGHNLDLRIENDGAGKFAPSRAPVLIKSYGRPTTRMKLRLVFVGDLPFRGRSNADPGSCIMLEVQGGKSSTPRIWGLDIAVDLSLAQHQGERPTLMILSCVDQSGSEVLQVCDAFADMAVEVRSRHTERVVLPPGGVARGNLTIRGDFTY